MIKTISDTVIWLAQERMKVEKFQNINSAIYATKLEITLELMKFMKLHNPKLCSKLNKGGK